MIKKTIILEKTLKKIIKNKLIENFKKKLLKEAINISGLQNDVFSQTINAIKIIAKNVEIINKEDAGKTKDQLLTEFKDKFNDIKICLTALLFLEFVIPEMSKVSSDRFKDIKGLEDIQNKQLLDSSGHGNLNTLSENFGEISPETLKKIQNIKAYDRIWNVADEEPDDIEDVEFANYLKELNQICTETLNIIKESNLKFLFNYDGWHKITDLIETQMKEVGQWTDFGDSCFTMEEIEILDEDLYFPLSIEKSPEVIQYICEFASKIFDKESALHVAGLTSKDAIDTATAQLSSNQTNTSQTQGNVPNAPLSSKKIKDDQATSQAIEKNLKKLLNSACTNVQETKKVGLVFVILHSLQIDAAFTGLKSKISQLIDSSSLSDILKEKLKALVDNSFKTELIEIAKIALDFFKKFNNVSNLQGFNTLVSEKSTALLNTINNFSNTSIIGLLLKNEKFINEINSKVDAALGQIQTYNAVDSLFKDVYIQYYNEKSKEIAIPVNVVNQHGAVWLTNGTRDIDDDDGYNGGFKNKIIENILAVQLDPDIINKIDSKVFENADTTPLEVADEDAPAAQNNKVNNKELVIDTKPADANMTDDQWQSTIKLIQDIQDGKRQLPPKLIDQLQGLLNKKGISKDEIKQGLQAAQQSSEEQTDADPLRDIFRVPQLNGGYFELAKILMSADLLTNYKNGNFKKKQYETAKAYGFIAKKSQELNSVETFFSTPDKIFNSLGLKLSPATLNKLTSSLNDSKKIGQLLNEYFDKKMLKVNEYLLIDGNVFMYITLRLLEDLGLESDNFNELHTEYVVQKDPIVIKASAQLNGDMLKQTIDLNKRISISQMLNNRSTKNKKPEQSTISTKSYEMSPEVAATQKNAYRIIQGQQGKDFKSELATIMSDAEKALAFTSAHRERIEELAEDFILDAYKTKEIKSVAELDRLKDLVNNTIDIKYGKQIPDKMKQQINQKIKNLWKGNITTVKRQ